MLAEGQVRRDPSGRAWKVDEIVGSIVRLVRHVPGGEHRTVMTVGSVVCWDRVDGQEGEPR